MHFLQNKQNYANWAAAGLVSVLCEYAKAKGVGSAFGEQAFPSGTSSFPNGMDADPFAVDPSLLLNFFQAT